MTTQLTTAVMSFVSGAVIGSGLTYLAHWLARSREKDRREFEQAQEKERLRTEHYRTALQYHKTQDSLRGFDLSGRDLAEVNLRKADLRGANLDGADLSAANLEEANLVGATLQAAILTGANLLGANLIAANLETAKLANANLKEAALLLANLQRSILVGANMEQANLALGHLAGALVRDSTVMPEGWESVVASKPEDAPVEQPLESHSYTIIPRTGGR